MKMKIWDFEVYRYGTKENLDPTEVKVDKCKKLFNYPKVYLLLQLVGTTPGRKKESMETETTVLASKKKKHILVRKRESRQRPRFFFRDFLLYL